MYDFTDSQKKDLAYFKENVSAFMNDNALRFKHVIISEGRIVKSFDMLDKAVEYCSENLKIGEYIIEQVIDENEIVNFV